MPAPYDPQTPPDLLTSQTDLDAWRNLFMARRSWALEVARECSTRFKSIQQRLDEIRTIVRADEVAMSNVKTHVSSLEQKYTEAQDWVRDVTQEQAPAVDGWQDTVSKLTQIPAMAEVLRSGILQGSGTQPTRDTTVLESASNASLITFVDTQSIERAAVFARKVLQRLSKRESELNGTVQRVAASSEDLLERSRQLGSHSANELDEESKRLMEDIEVIAKKVGSDYEHVLGLTESSKALPQASKMALVHTKDLLPSLSKAAVRMSRIHREAVQQRNASAKSVVIHLQKISAVESALADVTHQLSNLAVDSEGLASFDALSFLTRLPYMYGSILVESVRRREWIDKVKTDSATLAEEFAVYRDDEERRRRKWQRSIGEAFPSNQIQGRPLAVELNLHGEEKPLPRVERQDIDNYLESLSRADGMEGLYKEVLRLANESRRPTRPQSKRIKAFKQSSVHEAALGRSSLLLRGQDDSVRALEEEKAKLEEKLKGSESRIRKLEDLVHRHGDMNRNASGNVFQLSDNQMKIEQQVPPSSNQQPPTTPSPDDMLSRQSSVSSRRFSSNQGDNKVIVRKMMSLEAELAAERELTATLRKEASARQENENAMRGRIEEADSTKMDLMKNLEAQQREFVEERKLWEEDVSRLRTKLEEVEDELDRVLGSKENEKAGADERCRALRRELESNREQSKTQIDQLHHELGVEQESASKLQERVTEAEAQRLTMEDTIRTLEGQLQHRAESLFEQQKRLQVVHGRLSLNQVPPTGFERLVEAIEGLSERYSDHLRAIEDALRKARTENDALQSKVATGKDILDAVQGRLNTEETESSMLREQLVNLESELQEERSHIQSLRDKLAEGEIDADGLKKRLQEEESKAGELIPKLAATERQINEFNNRLVSQQDEIRAMHLAADSSATRLDTRSRRAQQVSVLLYSYKERLSRLLEALGFVVSHQDGVMMIQRLSKAMIASATEAEAKSTQDLNALVNDTASTDRAREPHIAHWMDVENPEVESRRFSAYMDALSEFDVDVFSEAIAKRVKEVEHVARKWQKEARAYRDKAHRFQLEAHEKIAFRSFREGDLALFLPTRNQATRPWAAFNVGAPHYFLREQDSHKLRTRDWLLARITKVDERVVDLSRTVNGASSTAGDRRSIGESSDGGASFDDENPFQLSDGLTWYLLDAAEEKPGAPSTPGLGKSTVASANVDAKGSVRVKKSAFSSGATATKTLSKSLDSRRSSSNSKKEGVGPIVPSAQASAQSSSLSDTAKLYSSAVASQSDLPQQGQQTPSGAPAGAALEAETRNHQPGNQEVRSDLLWGP